MKRNKLLMLGLTGVLMLAGCGKTEAERQEEQYESMTEADVLEKVEAIEQQEIQEQATEVTQQTDGYKHYDKAAGWKEGEADLGAVQVDDVIYSCSMTMDDFLQAINSSEVEYKFDYNPDKMMAFGDAEEIMIHRDGMEWFSVTFGNTISEGIIPLSEAIIGSITIRDAAKDYCRFVDGTIGSSLMGMSYSDAKAIVDKYPRGMVALNESSVLLDDGTDAFLLEYTFQDGIMYMEGQEGFFSLQPWWIRLYADRNTGTVTKVEYWSYINGGWIGIPENAVVSMKDLPQDVFESLVDEVASHWNVECTEYKAIGDCRHQDSGFMHYQTNILFFELTKEDGTTSYTKIPFDMLTFDSTTNTIDYSGKGGEVYAEEFDSIDAMLEKEVGGESTLYVGNITMNWY